MHRNATLALALLAALALPATASAKPTKQDKRNAAKECKLERGTTDASKAAFAEKYRNFGACVSTRAKQEAAERRAARRTAARDCRAERATDAAAFAGKYGTNANERNAFGKCVSAKAKQEKADEDREDKQEIADGRNAATDCQTERDAIGEQAFADKYGTNGNDKNAFGKCVSANARDEGDGDDPDSGAGS